MYLEQIECFFQQEEEYKMVIRIAWVDGSGNIKQLFTPSDYRPYSQGDEQDGLTLQYCGDGISPDTHYWKDGWFVKPTQPGDYYDWIEEAWALNSETLLDMIRLHRSAKLFASDWAVLPDSPLTDEKKAEWVTYRTALRDVPANNSDVTHLDDVTWPGEPS
jgi:hypothetical protein